VPLTQAAMVQSMAGIFPLEAYLADRVVDQGWPLAEVADELRAHLRTVRGRLDQHGLRR
jgi:hypothetical protein